MREIDRGVAVDIRSPYLVLTPSREKELLPRCKCLIKTLEGKT